MMNIFESWLVGDTIAKHGLFQSDAPEQSRKALMLAIEKKIAIMLSVIQIKDGTIICYGDTTLARLTGKNGYTCHLEKKDLATLTYLKTDEPILTLQEALEIVQGKVPLLINIINTSCFTDTEKLVVEHLSGYKGQYAFMSVNPITVQYLRKTCPDHFVGIKVVDFHEKKYCGFKTKKLKKLKYNKICDPQFICYNAKLLPNKYVKKYSNIPLLCYHVKTNEEYLEKIQYCDNIIIDGFVPKI